MFCFEDLEVYQKAFGVNQIVYSLLKRKEGMASYVKNQFGRASLSIMLNIAEGSAKFSKRDRRNFYITARGSVFECFALVSFLSDEGEIVSDTKDELQTSFEEISKMLFAMIKNLNHGKG